jgi:membrane-bound lytic murein transglycosylase F
MLIKYPFKHLARQFQHVLLFTILLLSVSCQKKILLHTPSDAFEQIIKRDTLNAIMLYGSSTYFIYKDQPMGYDYDLCHNFADTLGVKLNVITAKNVQEAISLLQAGKGDLIAVPIDPISHHIKQLANTDVGEQSTQVLVQPLGKNALDDVTELAGKEIYVLPDSRYSQRLQDLDNELGNTFTIKEVPDSISMDALIEMVAKGKIPYTVTSNKIAELNQNNITGVDFHLVISFPQRSSWVTLLSNNTLTYRINAWYKQAVSLGTTQNFYNKYTSENKFFADKTIRIPRGSISPYDRIFKQYAKQLGWNWRLLAAQAYSESHFDAQCISWAGACGLMQLMPNTAAHYGVDGNAIFNPADNTEAAVQYLKMLNMDFHSIPNKEERIKFILAAYHSGPGHVLDAMALTKKFGKNEHLWFGNVETFLKLKSEPQYYNDPVCQNGYCNATLTIRYVKNVLAKFDFFMRRK